MTNTGRGNQRTGWILQKGGLLLAAFLLLQGVGMGQERLQRPLVIRRVVPKVPKNSLIVSAGWMVPLSHNALKEFWNPGPSTSLALYVNVNRFVALGVGAEATLFRFNQGAFEEAHLGVAPHKLNTANLHLYVAWRYTGHLGPVLSPFLGASLGASQMTKAVYQVRDTNGIRHTYYEIPGLTRLTLGGSAGLDLNLSRFLSVVLEGRAQYLHNDPEAALFAGGRFGMRFNFP
jgi:hypothetical protein